MPTNSVESCLSQTADYFEKTVQADPALGNEFIALLNAGNTPFVYRLLDNTLKPGKYMLTIKVEAQPE